MAGIVVCIGQSNSGPLVLSYLEKRLPIKAVIRESKESRKLFIKRRIKRYGYLKVLGQLLFMALGARILGRSAGKRIDELISSNRLSTDVSTLKTPVTDVPSVNSEAARETLKAHDPDVILVIGTRIIGKKTLTTVNSRWINIHAGITPLFRGVHGGYWSRVTNKTFGTTIHYIDEGIDTGKVILQKEIQYDSKDNFLVYPYLQMIGILPELEQVLSQLLSGELTEMDPMYQESQLWTHPTLFQYIKYRMLRGAR